MTFWALQPHPPHGGERLPDSFPPSYTWGSCKQGKNRSTVAAALILLTIGTCVQSSPSLYRTDAEAATMVAGVCEYIYLLRPIVEWVGYGHPGEYLHPRAFLLQMMPALAEFSRQNLALLRRCAVLKRVIGLTPGLRLFLTSGSRAMAHHRAQSDVNSRGCGSYAPPHVAIARPRSLATRP